MIHSMLCKVLIHCAYVSYQKIKKFALGLNDKDFQATDPAWVS